MTDVAGTARAPEAPSAPHFGPSGIAVALLINAMFALNVTAMKVVVDASAPLTAAAARMTVVGLLCLPWLRRAPGQTRWLMLYGLINGGMFLLLMNMALRLASNLGPLAIAGQLGVPSSLLLGAMLLRERLRPMRLVGVALAFAGVAVLVFDRRVASEIPAVLVMAAASFLWGAGTLVQRKLGGIPALTTQAWNGAIGALALLPFALLLEPTGLARFAAMRAVPMGWFAFSCLGSTLVGQGLLACQLQRHSIAHVMPLMLVSPVIATLFASAYFHTPITLLMVLGLLVSMAGVAVIVLVPQRG